MVSATEEGILSVQEAMRAASAGDVLLIDVRRPEEWAQTGVPAVAIAITMHQDADDFFSQLAAATAGDPARPVALICAGGVRSAQLKSILERSGYGAVYDVGEGMGGSWRGPGWLAAGLPVRSWTPDDFILPATESRGE